MYYRFISDSVFQISGATKENYVDFVNEFFLIETPIDMEATVVRAD